MASWRRQWEQVILFFASLAGVRKIIYATNAIDSRHSQVRKTIRNKGHVANADVVVKLIYLTLRQIEAKWKWPPEDGRPHGIRSLPLENRCGLSGSWDPVHSL